MNEKQRNFRNGDDEMIEKTKVMHAAFIADKQTFQEFDSTFDDSFAKSWNTSILAVEMNNSDSTVVSVQQQLTQKVNALQDEGLQLFQRLRYFIEKAFPKQQAVWNEFGVGDYGSARDNQSKCIQFLNNAAQCCTKYQKELASAGFSKKQIDELHNIATLLSDANNDQELYKNNRQLYTEQRVDKLNELWEFAQKVAKASKIIFADEPAKQNLYKLN